MTLELTFKPIKAMFSVGPFAAPHWWACSHGRRTGMTTAALDDANSSAARWRASHGYKLDDRAYSFGEDQQRVSLAHVEPRASVEARPGDQQSSPTSVHDRALQAPQPRSKHSLEVTPAPEGRRQPSDGLAACSRALRFDDADQTDHDHPPQPTATVRYS